MPDIDKRLIHAFVLLQRQFLITEYVVKQRKPKVLRSFEKAITDQKQSIQDVLRVYELAFSIVDNIVRYEKIACILPRFNQRTDEFKLFSSRLDGMKELRNLLQHINEDIDTEFESPILGGITWAKNNINYMAVFNDLGEKRSVPGLIYDPKKEKFTEKFCYVHNGKYYDLSEAIKGYQDYQKFVESKCQITIDGKSYKANEHYVALAATIQLKDVEAKSDDHENTR